MFAANYILYRPTTLIKAFGELWSRREGGLHKVQKMLPLGFKQISIYITVSMSGDSIVQISRRAPKRPIATRFLRIRIYLQLYNTYHLVPSHISSNIQYRPS
jgi:hypothetical protein